MYLPEHFQETRLDRIHGLIDQNPLGTLVTAGAGGLDANQLPFHLEAAAGRHGRLLAHVARANPVWQEVRAGDEVLVVFRGADAYVSPNWYPSKQETHRQVPTWNYQVVNVHGRIHLHDDERFLRQVIAQLTHTHERRQQEAKPWKMSDSPGDFIASLVAKIVGIEIEITKVVAKSKLSQNRDERDRAGAAAELRKRGHLELSLAMAVAEASPPSAAAK